MAFGLNLKYVIRRLDVVRSNSYTTFAVMYTFNINIENVKNIERRLVPLKQNYLYKLEEMLSLHICSIKILTQLVIE